MIKKGGNSMPLHVLLGFVKKSDFFLLMWVEKKIRSLPGNFFR